MNTTLSPLSFPLVGSQLIEASAGTGKTFTIALLYVRLILGHGGASAFPGGALTPPEILVVTFTDAATRELRDRIRARLAEAARVFRAPPEGPGESAPPDILHELRASYAPDEWPLCARRLELAAEWMDEAAVSTIHGWCKRMLHEHAFDCQSLFTRTLETDLRDLLAEVVRDYWRTFFYPLGLEATATVRRYWASPDELEQAVSPLTCHEAQLPEPLDTPATLLANAQEKREKTLKALKAPWRRWADELQTLFDAAKAAKELDGRKLRADWYGNWLASLREWAGDAAMEAPEIGTGWKRLTPEGIAEAWKSGTPPDHPAFAHIAALPTALRELPEAKTDILCHAARWISQNFASARQQGAKIGFDDLLNDLDAALHGPRGERLAQLIRQQFPVAMIDEFQDTDPVQYRIFARIHEIGSKRQDCALILIGDPKQAIYAFRGADIHTYLKARRAIGGRLHSLDTNFRSTSAMVDAVNHCFAQVEAQAESPGAFRFRKDGDDPLPFHKVRANGLPTHFEVDGRIPAALTLALALAETGSLSKTAYIEQMAEICATQIVDWLNRGQAGQAGFVRKTGTATASPLTPLQPGDIAILVNNGNEAGEIRQALARRQLRSVYLSDRETVYATPQAIEVWRWLAACAEPENDRLRRAALSTPSLALSFAELDALGSDEAAWEARLLQFKGYRELWQKQGVLPMLRQLLTDFSVPPRLLSRNAGQANESGERVLTDILHLAELLQEASFTLEGEQALRRFLSDQIAAPEGEAEGMRRRLESDEALVKVVTIHKSKGLEYPLVFAPFLCATRLTKISDSPLKWHDDAGELQLSLQADDGILQRADEDRLGEDLRKVYVALTRARYLTWVGLAPLANNEPSAIGHLFGLPALEPAPWRAAVGNFVGEAESIALVEAPERHLLPFVPAQLSPPVGTACRLKRFVREHWSISSYSSLRLARHGGLSSPLGEDSPQADNLADEREEAPLPAMGKPLAASIHRFPRGAMPGSFLHDLMQCLANTGAGFAHFAAEPETLRDLIARRCQVQRWERWIDPLFAWAQALLATPLPLGPDTSVRLQTLETVRAEMEFWFETGPFDLTALDAAVVQHTLGARPRPPLARQTLKGMLKGFMDLVFVHEGRYYVADYKSTWLGEGDAAYTQTAMDDAVRKHRYELQYVLYLFALHRLLKSRLPDYDYERHIGGAVYLFVRGIASPGAGVHFERPPAALMQQLEGLFSGHRPG